MSGTIQGGKRAARTNKDRYGEDHYAVIGAIGGAKGTTGGFASEVRGKDGLTGRERARTAGYVGGKKSKRKKQYERQQA